MLDTQKLKFEKCSSYLKEQLGIQENNKQLILDIISNIGLIADSSLEKDKYDVLLKSANDFLQMISNNLTTINQLDLEMTNISKELSDLLEEQKNPTKSKAFYVTAFSNIKNNIISYSEKFQDFENKLENDMKEFNEFINVNNFKYTFDSVNDSENSSYEFTGFSVNEDNSVLENNINDNDILENSIDDIILEDFINENFSLEDLEISEDEILENNEEEIITDSNDEVENIDEITDNFKNLLLNISDDESKSEIIGKINNYIFRVQEDLNTPQEDILSEPEEDLFIPVLLADKPSYSDTNEKIEPISDEDIDLNFNFEKAFNDDLAERKKFLQLDNSENLEEIDQIQNPIIEEPAIIETNFKELEDLEISDIENISNDKISILENFDNNITSDFYLDISDIAQNGFEISDNSFLFEEKNDTPNKLEPEKNTIVDIEKLISNVKSSYEDSEKSTSDIKSEIVETIMNDEEIDYDSILDGIDDADILLDIFSEENDFLLDFEKELIPEIIEEVTNDNKEDPLEIENKTDAPSEENIEDIIHQNAKEKIDDLSLSDEDIDNKISSILESKKDNDYLIISEKNGKIYLPYKLSELENYIKSYPEVYFSPKDVVMQEFVLPFDFFNKENPYKQRFLETYNILRNHERLSVLKSITYSLNIAKKNNINPAIIAACKTLNELESYIYYLEANNLKKFKFFKIIYQINPL